MSSMTPPSVRPDVYNLNEVGTMSEDEDEATEELAASDVKSDEGQEETGDDEGSCHPVETEGSADHEEGDEAAEEGGGSSPAGRAQRSWTTFSNRTGRT